MTLLMGALALPANSEAKEVTSDANAPSAMGDDDPDCGESIVILQVDTVTGAVYRIDASGMPILTDNEINVYFNTLSTVLVEIQYTGGEWDVDVTADNEPTESYTTRRGVFRYPIVDSYETYVFDSYDASSTMNTAMVPIPPIVIKPDSDCPPPP